MMETSSRIFVVYRTTRTGLAEGAPDVFTDKAEALTAAEALAARRGVFGSAVLQDATRVAYFGGLPAHWVEKLRGA
jgi:hypothetical protein